MKFKHNISRIEAFSDAVFAFAATLMMVSFDLNENNLITESKGTDFISFGVSFFTLVGLWWVHYNFFRRTDYMDNWIIALNSVLLFVILYYVFPLKSLLNSMFGKERITLEQLGGLFELYSLGFVLIFLCLALMYFRAYKKTKTLENSMTLLFYTRHFGIFVLIAIISMLIAKFRIGVAYGIPGFVYVLLGPLCHFHAVYFHKKIKSIDE